MTVHVKKNHFERKRSENLAFSCVIQVALKNPSNKTPTPYRQSKSVLYKERQHKNCQKCNKNTKCKQTKKKDGNMQKIRSEKCYKKRGKEMWKRHRSKHEHAEKHKALQFYYTFLSFPYLKRTWTMSARDIKQLQIIKKMLLYLHFKAFIEH